MSVDAPLTTTAPTLARLRTLVARLNASAEYHLGQGWSGPDLPRSMHRSRGEAEQCVAVTLHEILDELEADTRYTGGPWHRRTVELLELLSAATKVQREPCDHAGIGRPGCVTCDLRIRETLGIGSQAREADRG